MRLNYLYVFIFFATVALGSLLLFPTSLDVVTLYRNSYLYSTALDLLDQLEDKRPEDERVSLEQARVLYLAGRYEEAVKLLKRMTARAPDHPEIWRQLAHTYRTIQQHRKASDVFEHLLARAPADSESLYLLEEYYRWFQLVEKRIANLEALTEHFPEDFYNYEKLVDLYMRTGRVEDAVLALERTIRAFPDSVEIRAKLGQVYLAQKDARALPIFARLHEQHPEREDFFHGLLNALIIRGGREEVLARFQQRYGSRLSKAEYYQRLGQLYLYLNDADQAIRTLEERLALSPSVDTRLQLIDLYGRTRQYDRAADHARRLVQARPERADFWEIYADYLAAAERKQVLVETLEQYTARWPENPKMWLELADAHEWIEDYAAALPIARRFLKEEPERDDYRERLARVHYSLDNYEPAARHYARLLRRHPDSETYRQGLLLAVQDMPSGSDALAYARQLYLTCGPEQVESALLLARLHEEQGQLDRADPVYARLVQAHPDSGRLRARIGQLLLDSGRPEPARHYFLQTLHVDPDEVTALTGLAEIAHRANPQEALRYLGRLERQRPDDPEIVYRQGLLYEALGDSVRMVDHFQRLLEMIAEVRRTDLYFFRQKAHVLYRTGSISEAQAFLEQAQQRYPDSYDTLNDYAEILIAQGQYREALEILDKVPEL